MSRSFACLVLVLGGCLVGFLAAATERPGTDTHGDPLPAGAISRLGSLRWYHSDLLTAVAFSPDGKALATAAGTGSTIRLWEIPSGKPLQTLTGRAPSH